MKLKMLLLGIGLGLLLTGCSQATAAEKPPLKIAWSAWPGWYPVVLAEEWGLFDQRGLKVELLPYQLASDVTQEYAAGKADGALLTGYDVLPINARPGDSSPIVLVTDNALAADAVVATSEIRTPADLKGKTLGVKFGSYAEVLINVMLKENGLSASDVRLVDLPPEAIPNQLGKTIDAGHTYEPYLSQAISQGGQVIFTGQETPGLLMNVLTFRGSVLKDRPEDVRAFIDAFLEAQERWRNRNLEGGRVIAGAIGKRPEDIRTDGIRLYGRSDNMQVFGDPTAPSSLHASLANDLKFLLETGVLNKELDLNQLIDGSFLQK